MTRPERHKRYEFVKLCSSLTKQGLQFDRQKGVSYCLTFDKWSAKQLLKPDTKAPFVNAFIRVSGDRKRDSYQFEQWSGRN